ncbi:MAG: agmatinase [Desulfobacterales bacterium]
MNRLLAPAEITLLCFSRTWGSNSSPVGCGMRHDPDLNLPANQHIHFETVALRGFFKWILRAERMNPPDLLEASWTQEIVVLGVPLDWNSSFRTGSALAPERIRQALLCESSNLWTESVVDLGRGVGWRFSDDIEFADPTGAFALIEQRISRLLESGARVISLGGDHSITYPIIRAYARRHPALNILHLDAHPDLYHEFDGNRYSHACPFARIMEERLVSRLVQVGIRTLTGHQREQARRFGAEVIEMREIRKAADLSFEGPVYLSVDMDCLDPAFSPGVSHPEPGGMSTREVLGVIQNFSGALVGADIVEYNPESDHQGMTAITAGKLLKEILGKMLEGVRDPI